MPCSDPNCPCHQNRKVPPTEEAVDRAGRALTEDLTTFLRQHKATGLLMSRVLFAAIAVAIEYERLALAEEMPPEDIEMAKRLGAGLLAESNARSARERASTDAMMRALRGEPPAPEPAKA
jgi:hypothetical protein